MNAIEVKNMFLGFFLADDIIELAEEYLEQFSKW